MSRHLITSAIPYVNGVKHLGNLIGSMLPADVYARFRRAQGHDVLFICGTDDHGTPVEIAAQKAKQPTAEFVKYWHEFQENIYRSFGLGFDWFGSSSRAPNHALTQHLARKLMANGLLEPRTHTMLYSKVDARFLPDRYVEGTCPKCGNPKARGDECEVCGSVHNPTDLLNPYSAISGSRDLELRNTTHLYFKQSQLVPQLRAWIDQQTHWPHLSRSIAYKWLDEGLEDRGITRDIQWGVPVPADLGADLAGKVFYVWFDAPIAYIAATQEWATAVKGEPQPTSGVPLSPAAQSWWFGDAAKDVTYTEFMGKDNVYFHTLSFPATLIGSAEPWVKVNTLKSFNWLTYYGGKFSTSQGIGIFTDQALQEIADPDTWRYYLLARAPESDDSSFTWTDLQNTINKDLADVLGNFINRTLTFTHKSFGGTVPHFTQAMAADEAFAARLNGILARLTTAMEDSSMRKSAETLRELWVAGNEYLAAEEPWKVLKTDPTRAASILNIAIHTIALYACAMQPFMPATARRIMAIFGKEPQDKHGTWPWPENLKTFHTAMGNLTTFTLPQGVLFTKITDEQVEAWEAKYGNTKA